MLRVPGRSADAPASFGRGDDTIGKPSLSSNVSIRVVRAYPLMELNKQLLVEEFEATVSHSTVPSPPLIPGS